MKKQRSILRMAISQNRRSIKDALVRIYRSMYSPLRLIETKTILNFKAMIRKNAKGPPSRSNSPGKASHSIPDKKNVALINGKDLYFNKLHYLNTKRIFNYYQYFIIKFYHFLILKTMKKQIFILTVALFAIGMSKAFGQLTAAVTCPVPRTIDVTCLPSDALHPIPGTPYDYTVVVPTPAGTKAYTWFVTQDPNFIAAGVLTANRETSPGVHIAASGTGYNNPATGAATLSLTWKSFVPDPALPVFVVINVTNQAPAPGCLSMNMKVFKIDPVNAFTLDIANVGPAGGAPSAYETSIDRCIHDIVSATYDATAGGVVYDFGVDYLYYVVTAANFSTSWLPSVNVPAIDAKETVTAVEWFRPTDNAFATPGAFTDAAGTWTANAAVPVLDPSGTVGAAGECIVIRVTVDHTNGANNYQGLTDETVTVAVDGKTQLALATPLGDIHFSKTVGTAADCGLEDGFRNDVATQIIKPRPDITAPAMPAPGLLPVLP